MSHTFYRVYVNYTECDSSQAAAVAVDFIKVKKVDAIIGPPCFSCEYFLSSPVPSLNKTIIRF